MELDDVIEKFALANALKFNGKANQGSVFSHVISAHFQAKSDLKDTAKRVSLIIAKVNNLSFEEQFNLLSAKYPEMLEVKEPDERDLFAFLKISEGSLVKSAFPPGPEKYPHLGHAKALFLNEMLAKRFNGRFVLRFEDTNPELVKDEFYNIMLENFKWLGVDWDELQYASDHMQLFYDCALKIIESGDAYICTCSVETIRDNRMKGFECKCRSRIIAENLDLWHDYAKMQAGSSVLRLKIGLTHANSTMRDPAIFRLLDAAHARQGTKYRIWPNYDFQNAVMDGYFQVTHRLRSKEFELRSELQRYIQGLLGLPATVTYEFGRFNLTGVESSGRVIREKIQKGEFIGWDDPRLTTLVALRRRGFTPAALKSFVVSTGITKNDATLTWDDLILHNRRVLDEKADRYFFVKDPVRVRIVGAPSQVVILSKHPHLRKGGRVFKTSEEFHISNDDFACLIDGELYRLMDCLNFVRKGSELVFHSQEYENYKALGKRIMHYLPANAGLQSIEVFMPDAKKIFGLGEEAMKDLKVGDIIQAERFGFMRLDSVEGEKLRFWYAHP